MSLDKSIQHGKEYRKEYKKKSHKYCKSCRPGGSCPRCQSDRQINSTKGKLKSKSQIEDHYHE